MSQEELIPQKMQLAVKEGFERMKTYKRANAMFVREYVGQYYGKKFGLTGEAPLNLIYNLIRAMVPNLVMQNPINEVSSPYLKYKAYAEMLGMGLNETQKSIRLKATLRGWVTSSLFGWGIMKVSVAVSGQLLKFGDIYVDPGQVYAELVSLDNFVIDPVCSSFKTASFMGHKTMVPRQILLDTDIYNHDLVKKLPMSRSMETLDKDRVSDLTRTTSGALSVNSIQDYVDVVEVWVPEANAIATIPDPYQVTFDEYIGIQDYYGPKEGPYVDLAISQPVDGNPFPVAPVSVIYDLHKVSNEIFNKIISQALAQKDVVLYNPAQADEAEDLRDSEDGDYLKSVDPKNFQPVSIGGQNRSNEVMMDVLQSWFNYMAANPDQMNGSIAPGGSSSQTATKASILQSNASIGIEDARDMLYDQTAEVSRRMAWYLHYDPFVQIPFIQRSIGGEEVQRILTPEERRGDFLDFAFKIKERSMSRMSPEEKARKLVEFGTNILPGAVNAANMMLMMGQQFNLAVYLTKMGRAMGLEDEVADIFFDPEFQQRMLLMMSMGPKGSSKSGGSGGGGILTMDAIMQNGGLPTATTVPNEQQAFNASAQVGANNSQSDMRG